MRLSSRKKEGESEGSNEKGKERKDCKRQVNEKSRRNESIVRK